MFIIDTEEKNNNKKMKNTWANKNIFIKGYIYLSNVFQPGLVFTNLALKNWAPFLATHTDSTVQKYVWVRHWLNQWPS